jgi:hypothetical protein
VDILNPLISGPLKKVLSAAAVDINQFYAGKNPRRSFLMKTKRYFFGLPAVLPVLGLVLAASLALAGCGDSSENTEPKSIRITGMGTAGTSGFIVGLFSALPEEGEPENEITGFGMASNGEATIALKIGNPQDEVWTGTGSYYVNAIDTGDDGLIYLYTGDGAPPNETYSNVVKINFSDTVTTVSLDKFASMENDLPGNGE